MLPRRLLHLQRKLRLSNPMDLTSCAQIAKTYGNKGEVLLRIKSDRFSEMLEGCQEKGKELEDPVFIYFDGLPVPFFISSATHRNGNAWVVTFSTIRDNDHAEEVVGRDLFLEAKDEDRFSDLDILVGYTVISEEGVKAGTISRVIEYPNNICLELEESETLLPFHEDLVLSFDQENRTIVMTIPQGLL